MAGTVTVSELGELRGLRKIQWDWLSDASGDATLVTSNVYTGRVHSAVFDPDSGGTTPSANYDVTVTDGDGYDVLAGAGANLSETANVYKLSSVLGAAFSSTLTLTVANAGAAKGGMVTLFIK